MSIFGNLFGVFSLSPEAASKAKHTVPERTRRRVIMLSTEVFSDSSMGDYTEQFWEDIHRLLRYRHGQMQLTKDHPITSVRDDVFRFVLSYPGEEFLDFIEYIFEVDAGSKSPTQKISSWKTLIPFFVEAIFPIT